MVEEIRGLLDEQHNKTKSLIAEGDTKALDEINRINADIKAQLSGLETEIASLKSANIAKATEEEVAFMREFQKHFEKEGINSDNFRGKSFKMDTKTPSTMTNLVAGKNPTFMGFADLGTQNHVRSIISAMPTGNNAANFIRETGVDGAPVVTAEGVQKPQMQILMAEATAPIVTLPVFLKVTRQFLDDAPLASAFITRRGTERLLQAEDAELLYGVGGAGKINGVYVGCKTSADIAASFIKVSSTNIDAVLAGMSVIASQNYSFSHITMNPADFFLLLTVQGTGGSYLSPITFDGGQYRIYGTPVALTTAQTAGSFGVGDFSNGATILQRTGIDVGFFEQDTDNVQKNIVTIRIEERLGLMVDQPGAFYADTFAATKTAIAS